MSGPPSASRPSPPVVPPVTHEGVRYQQDDESARHGGGTLGGWLVAIDEASGERLWMLEVYRVAPIDPRVSLSAMGRYFKSLRVVPGEDALEIENEVGGRYRVELASRTSRWISGPRSEHDGDNGPPPCPKPPSD